MTSLVEAINSESTVTENGMPTYASSLDAHVDLFFKVGASRGKDIIPDFSKAFGYDKELAIRIALWARDVRGGAGERKLFRDILVYLANKDVEMTKRIVPKVQEIGRWDDLLCLIGTPLERDVLRTIATALNNDDSLCAKWMPRKGSIANKLRSYMQKTPKQYRKMLVELTNVVETKMCSNDWESIEFGKLPSLAAARYQTAFNKHVPELYNKYKLKLETGEEKINASAVYPYDVYKSVKKGDAKVADAQWNALPDYLAGSTENIMPVVDVSESMEDNVGGSNSITCKEVAISLGLYLSERTKGIFKDTFISFSMTPKLHTVKGSLSDRFRQMGNDKGYNTDLEKVFNLILDSATKHKVAKDEMPTMLLLLSDMQFDSCCSNSEDKAIEMIERKYKKAGYDMPKIVFWNLRASNGVPVTHKRNGTALVSGFSPAIMTSLLGSKSLTPFDVMIEAVNKDRYNF